MLPSNHITSPQSHRSCSPRFTSAMNSGCRLISDSSRSCLLHSMDRIRGRSRASAEIGSKSVSRGRCQCHPFLFALNVFVITPGEAKRPPLRTIGRTGNDLPSVIPDL